MRKQLKPRADLDDGDPPFVQERDAKVPHCVKCGLEVTTALSLWTLCEVCIRRSLELPATPVPRHPQGTHAMIAGLAQRMRLKLDRGEGKREKVVPASVLWHEGRFLSRGLDPSSARRLSESLATDSIHRAGCERCKADVGPITDTLLRPEEETERLACVGRFYLPKRTQDKGHPVA
jgi:hypothetical protein